MINKRRKLQGHIRLFILALSCGIFAFAGQSIAQSVPDLTSSNSKSHDWEETRLNGLEELLPIIRQHYLLSQTAKRPKDNTSTYSADDISLGVLIDYTQLIEFALSRKEYPRVFQDGSELTQLVNVTSYEKHFKKLPDNITIFNPQRTTSQHYLKDCDIECEKLLLENHVKFVTTIAHRRIPNDSDSSKNTFLDTRLNDSNSTLTPIATRHYKAACEPITKGHQYPHWRNLHPHRHTFINHVLDLCIANETVEIPKHGFFFNEASPLWPEELTVKDIDQALFTQLDNIKVKRFNATHWAFTTFKSPVPNIRYEEVCLKVSPALPNSAVDALRKQLRINKGEYFANQPRRSPVRFSINLQATFPDVSSTTPQGLQPKTISSSQGTFCYFPEYASSTFGISNRFFPRPPNRKHRLDFRSVMSVDEIIEKLNGFTFHDASEPASNSKVFNRRRGAFLKTLEFLSQDHPDYYDDIFPAILPRIFDTSMEGANVGDGYGLAEHFFRAMPPAGSLSNYSKEVETIYNKRLKAVGCKGWKCPESVLKEGKLNAHNHLIAALGKEGIPLLKKMEKAGLENTKRLELCLGALTSKTKRKYASQFLDQLEKTPRRLDYDLVRALLMTDHSEFVIDRLNAHLAELKEVAAEKDGDVQTFEVSRNRYIEYGIPRKFQNLPAGKRYQEIRTVEDVLNEHVTNRRFCEYRKGHAFDPLY